MRSAPRLLHSSVVAVRLLLYVLGWVSEKEIRTDCSTLMCFCMVPQSFALLLYIASYSTSHETLLHVPFGLNGG
jgi:hypothetical protein